MTISIAQAAESSGLSIDTLRYYERIGLVDPPARDSGGRRVYTEADLTWLSFLTRLRTTGMPIRMMREYARLRRHGVTTASRRRQILQEHRAQVRKHVEELNVCLGVLDHKISNYEQCEQGLTDQLRAAQEASA